MTKAKYIIGSVSHGTMRPEDLIPRFLDVLKELDEPAHRKIVSIYGDIIDTLGDNDATSDPEQDDECLTACFDALDRCCPPYFYFGSHQGDGSDYGFWLSEESLEDFDGLKVSDTSDVPEDYQGEVLHVNDHGNCTLYTADGKGNLSEVWAIV